MKRVIFASIIVFSILSMSFVALTEILEKLAIRESSAQSYILNNLTGSFNNAPLDVSARSDERKIFQIPRVKLSAIISGDKATAATELCAYVKAYASSKEFAAEYVKKRENAKPTSEPYRMDAATIAEMKKGVKQMEADLAKMKAQKLPAAAVQQMEAAIAQQKKQIADQSDPTPNKTQWEKQYPADPATMIKNKLNEYLALVKTVDFKAGLTGSGDDKKFTNPAYEAKSLKWKAIYRAGPEVNKAVTQFVNEWLREGIETNITSMPKQSKSLKATAFDGTNETQDDNDAAQSQADNSKSLKGVKSKLKSKLSSVINNSL